MRTLSKIVSPLLILAMLTACASTSSTPTATAENNFSNVLVIGIANSFNNRAEFERTLVSELRSDSVSATALYTVSDSGTPIDRALIEMLVAENDYDAVLITRVLSREFQAKVETESGSTKKVRKDGSVGNLFRYDYEEINGPTALKLEADIIISAELFSTKSGDSAWDMEADLPSAHSISVLIADAADKVATRLRRSRLLAR